MVAADDDAAPSTAERVSVLRYRITSCRESLRTGVPAAMAVWFLMEIQRAEAELLVLDAGPTAEEGSGEAASDDAPGGDPEG